MNGERPRNGGAHTGLPATHIVQPDAAEAQLEAVLRLAGVRPVLDAALLGGPQWLAADVLHGLADLVESAARWTDLAAELAA